MADTAGRVETTLREGGIKYGTKTRPACRTLSYIDGWLGAEVEPEPEPKYKCCESITGFILCTLPLHHEGDHRWKTNGREYSAPRSAKELKRLPSRQRPRPQAQPPHPQPQLPPPHQLASHSQPLPLPHQLACNSLGYHALACNSSRVTCGPETADGKPGKVPPHGPALLYTTTHALACNSL